MKLLFASFAFVIVSVVSHAQSDNVVGRWKIVKLSNNKTGEIDLVDTLGSEQKLLAAARKEDSDFTEQDSIMVVFAGKILMEMFSGATMEFKNDGTYQFTTNASMGGQKKAPENGTYTVDKAKKIISSTVRNKNTNYQYEFKDNRLYLSMIREAGKKDMVLVLEKAN